MSAAEREFNELMQDKEKRRAHPEDDNDDDDDDDDDNDSDDARSFLNLSDDDDTPVASQIDNDDDTTRRTSTSLARNTIPLTRYEANTGPKGVISDAQNFRDSRRIHRISMRSNSTLGSTRTTETPASNNHNNKQVLSEKLSEEDEDEEEDLEDDPAFMRKWRKSRLQELQNGSAPTRESKLHTRQPSSRRFWGGLATVDGNGFLDAVDKSPEDTVVVVYIYDDYSHVSTSIEDCIRALASRHLDVRFVKLHFQDAEMEPAGVPALLAYQGGEKFAGLVPIIQEVPDDADLSASTLEAVLRRHQILR